MAALSDLRFQALRSLGYTGATSDMLLAWLKAESGYTGWSVPDAWKAYLEVKVVTPPGDYLRSDWWYAYLGEQGYEGNMNDREYGFWYDLANPVPPPPSDDFGPGFGPGFD